MAKKMKPAIVPCATVPHRYYKQLETLRKNQHMLCSASPKHKKQKPKKKVAERVQVTLHTPENSWVICLKVPISLHGRIEAFQKAMHCEINDIFGDIFEDGIISEDNIESYLSNNGY